MPSHQASRHKTHKGSDDSDFSDAGRRSSLDRTFALPRGSSRRTNRRGSFDSERSPSPNTLPLPTRPDWLTQHAWEEKLLKRQNEAVAKAKKKNPGLTKKQADVVRERALKPRFFERPLVFKLLVLVFWLGGTAALIAVVTILADRSRK